MELKEKLNKFFEFGSEIRNKLGGNYELEDVRDVYWRTIGDSEIWWWNEKPSNEWEWDDPEYAEEIRIIHPSVENITCLDVYICTGDKVSMIFDNDKKVGVQDAD